MEINLPESQLKRPDIEISIQQESTRTVPNSSNIYRKIYRKLAALMQIDGKYILDCRYETDGNIAHIMTGAVPRVLAVEKICDRVTLLLRSNGNHMAKNVQTAGLIHTLHGQRH
jgi:hypothetical protein